MDNHILEELSQKAYDPLEIVMRKNKASSHEKEKQLEAQRPMHTYHDWLWYNPARLNEHPIHAKILKSEKKLRKVKKKVRPRPK